MQPKIRGRITDEISIFKRGKGCIHRTLRVAGLDAAGRPGHFEKDLGAARSEDWVFHADPAGRPLARRLIDNKDHDATAETLGPGEDLHYRYQASDWQGDIVDFNLYSSPATLRVQ